MAELEALGIPVDSSQAARATGALDKMTDAARKAEKGVDNLGTGSRRAAGGVNQLAGSADRLAQTLRRGFAALTTGLLTRALVNAADGWTRLQNQVGAATRDMAHAADTMERMVEISRASFSTLDQTVQAFSSAAVTFRGMGRAADEAADFVESLNLHLVAGYVEGQQAASVTLALSRAMAVGTLRAQGLETVLGNSMEVAEALANELGVTVNELRGLAAQGKITGDVIANAMIGNLETMRDVVSEMPWSIGGAMTALRLEFQVFAASVNEGTGATAAMAQGVRKLADAFQAMSSWDWARIAERGVRLLADAAAALTAVLAVRLVGALAATTVAAGGVGIAFTAQYYATVALTGATAALGRALALVGGPITLIAAGIGLIVMEFIQGARAAKEFQRSIDDVRGAQNTLDSVLSDYYALRSEENAKAVREQAELLLSYKRTALAAAEAELASASFYTNLFGYSLYETERMAAARQAIDELRAGIIEAEAVISAMDHATGDLVINLDTVTIAAQAANDELEKMIAGYEQRTELARLENQYGSESLTLMAARLAQQRQLVAEQVAMSEATDEVKRRTMEAYDAMIRAESAGEAWAKAVENVKDWADNARAALEQMARAEPGAGWLDTAIAKAAALAGQLWDGVAAMAAHDGGFTGPRPQARPRDIDFGVPAVVRGAGGGAAKVNEFADVMKRLNDELERNRIAMRYNELTADIWQAQRDAGVEALSLQGQQIEATMRQIAAQEQQLSMIDRIRAKTDEWKSTIQDAFVGFVTGAKSFRQAVVDIIAKLAEMMAMKAFEVIWGGGAMGGGIGGGIGGFIGKLFGFADGTSSAPGGMAWVGERGPELVSLPAGARVYNAQASRDMARQGQAGGTVRIIIEEADGFAAKVKTVAQGVAVQVTAAAARRQSDQQYLSGGA